MSRDAPSYDVLIAGGGPGGTTAAALLADAGHSVLLLERDHFPRFHIGESLLPAELPLFEKLGFDPKAVGAVYKQGADFIDEEKGQFARFLGCEADGKVAVDARQIRRRGVEQAATRGHRTRQHKMRAELAADDEG